MNILAFDTCFDACSAAAGRGLRSLTPRIACRYEPMATGQAERLIPMIETVMDEAGLAFTGLNRITVTIGPGTFTGTRIAVSAARALSLATGAPIVPLSSLTLMAMNPRIPSLRGSKLVIATDARRDEVYLQRVDAHTLLPLGPATAVAVSQSAAAIGPGPAVIAGSGAIRVAEAARAAGIDATAVLPDLLPDALDMLFASASLPVAVSAVNPLYLRPPDAKPPTAPPLHGAGA